MYYWSWKKQLREKIVQQNKRRQNEGIFNSERFFLETPSRRNTCCIRLNDHFPQVSFFICIRREPFDISNRTFIGVSTLCTSGFVNNVMLALRDQKWATRKRCMLRLTRQGQHRAVGRSVMCTTVLYRVRRDLDGPGPGGARAPAGPAVGPGRQLGPATQLSPRTRLRGRAARHHRRWRQHPVVVQTLAHHRSTPAVPHQLPPGLSSVS